MSLLVPLVMFGWIPVVLSLFVRYPARRAVIISFVVAWLFLPQAGYPLPGLPDYTKMSATCYGILLATFIYDAGRFRAFKPGWLDLPMGIWCLSPMASSIANDLGAYDGFSSSMEQVVTWGLPYFLGRLYLGNLVGLKQLAIAIFAGGLAYVPLCLLESRISPQLHRLVYGFHASLDFSQTMRMGGYRPTVFMVHGLAVGAWMMAATLIGMWLWYAGVLKSFWGKPIKLLALTLLFTFINCRSTGAYLLLVIGLGVLFGGKKLRTTLPLLVLIAFITGYLYLGVSGAITPERRAQINVALTKTLNAERAQSLDFRLANEEILGEKARESPMFGWGGWGRARVYDDYGKDISVTDSLWIIAFGNQGVLGVISLFSSILLPSLCFCFSRYRPHTWKHPDIAPAACLTVVSTLFALDCVLNAMVNPVFTLACGGIAGLVMHPQVVKPAQTRRLPKKIAPSKRLTTLQH